MENPLQATDTNNSKKALVKSTVLLIVLTVISKLFGFGREMAQAYFFGADINTDAYLVAMTIPTTLFMAVSGSINNVFVPVYDQYKTLGRDKSLVWRFARISLILCTIVFIVPVFLNTNFAVRLFAPKLSSQGIAIAAGMLRILIFIIFFRLFSAIATAVLHVNRNFLIPGMVGIPYNIAIIVFSALLSARIGISALVWGTFVGVGLQFFLLMPWLARTRMQGSIGDDVSQGIRRIAFLLPPVLMGSFAGQAKAMIDRIFASGLAEGSISYLNYAVRIEQLPVGLLVVTVVTVLYPTLVSQANSEKWLQYRNTLAGALNTMFFIMLPIVAGFAILALPITQLIYQRGEFSLQAAKATAFALRFYSPLLLGTMLYRLMVKAFYAIKDTRTPLYAMLLSVTLNIIFNLVLIRFLAHGGLALATSFATITAALYMFFKLSKRTGPLLDKRYLRDMVKSLVATMAMAALCLATYNMLLPQIADSFSGRALYIGGIIVICAGFYFALAWLMKISAMDEARAIARNAKAKILRR